MVSRAWAIALAIGLLPAAAAAGTSSDDEDCSDRDVVQYSAPKLVQIKDRIVIKRGDAKAANAARRAPLEWTASGQGTAKFAVVEKPKFAEEGPWTTKVRVVGNKARPIDWAIEFRGHWNDDVKLQWINEKLLFFKVWWGRLLATDMILNIDTGEPIYVEEANYHSISAPCDQK